MTVNGPVKIGVLTKTHPPAIIFILLFGLGLVSALLAGYSTVGSRSPKRLPTVGFAVMMAVTVYVILDME